MNVQSCDIDDYYSQDIAVCDMLSKFHSGWKSWVTEDIQCQ